MQNNTFSKINFYLLEKKEVNKRNRKNKKQVDITIRGVFGSKMLKKHEIGDEKGDKKRKEREDTKQFEPGGKWNTKNMCSKKKNKRKRETHRENKVKKKKGD